MHMFTKVKAPTALRQGKPMLQYSGKQLAPTQLAFPRKRLISTPQRDYKQPSKCLSQRLRLYRGVSHIRDRSTADLKVSGLRYGIHNLNRVWLVIKYVTKTHILRMFAYLIFIRAAVLFRFSFLFHKYSRVTDLTPEQWVGRHVTKR